MCIPVLSPWQIIIRILVWFWWLRLVVNAADGIAKAARQGWLVPAAGCADRVSASPMGFCTGWVQLWVGVTECLWLCWSSCKNSKSLLHEKYQLAKPVPRLGTASQRDSAGTWAASASSQVRHPAPDLVKWNYSSSDGAFATWRACGLPGWGLEKRFQVY